ncbi:MAG: BlaI/MecI/CopY family transcriptional regulator, partial [Flavobacteriaceae bacterium]
MTPLTKAEEEVMKILWQLKKANVKTIIKQFPEPKPA